MSTTNQNEVLFSIWPEAKQHHFRLLELPPDLLAMLTSDHPPILHFKSSAPPDGRPGGAPASRAAVICTDARTYHMRQVNTSNSVYIAQPHVTLTEGEDDDEGNDNDGYLPRAVGLQAIAVCDSSLELSPVASAVQDAKTCLKAVLPTYSSTGHYQSQALLSKAELFANIPFSNRECEAALRALACFELENPAGCFIPSGQAKVRAWKSMLANATADSIDLTSALSREASTAIIDPEEDWPPALSLAVRDAVTMAEAATTTFQAGMCVEFVGRSLLEASTQEDQSVTSVAGFLADWANALPEGWRGQASLSLLKGQYVLMNEGREITLAGEDEEGGGASNSKATKRKWHDKFRASSKKAA